MNKSIVLYIIILAMIPLSAYSEPILFEDFEDASWSDWDGSRRAETGLVITTEGTPFQGSYHARATHLTGTLNDNYQEHKIGDYYSIGGTKLEEIWWSGHVKFSANYVTWPSDNVKVMLLNLTDGIVSTRRYQVMVQARKFSDADQAEYRVQYSYIGSWRFFGIRQHVGQPAYITPGSWDKIKLYCRLNTPNLADGVIKMWINDELKIDQTNLNIRENTSFGFGKYLLSSYTRNSSLQDGYQYYDNWTLSEEDPDLGSNGGSPPPSPPSDFRLTE